MRISRLALVLVLVVTACARSSAPEALTSLPAVSTTTQTTVAGPTSLPTPPPTTPTHPTTPATSPTTPSAVSTTTTEPPPIATTSTTPTTSPGTIPTTTVQAEAGPEYIIAVPDGVFRVVDGRATLVLDQPDVIWAADDGMGGIVYYPDPGIIEHLPVGATTPTRLATNASPDFVTLINGRPTLEIIQMSQQDECDDADSSHAVLVDLITGEHRVYIPCLPVESQGIHPRSMGGAISVSARGGGWPPDTAVWGQLSFRNIELPDWVASLTEWDKETREAWATLELDLPANPWPEPCHWCTLSPQLSPDGATLALAEFVPTPSDLGATDWATFNALDLADQWQRWEDLRRSAEVRLRTIDLTTGHTLYTELVAGPGWVLDFDGRYLLFEFGGVGHHSQFPYNMHLIDTHTGTEIHIDWGVTDPGHSGHISLALSD